ncbi:hypothetical protein GOP47_0007984 [Adiantum capillus-veneris]|uniref:Uncharacterized protein n=1 Tax=Adiantum capillus-veneris TaxID=13818 RepID=A0A9D4ZMH6_ADICA|nr:hypothetical protein GOP47_0007984 [Adiantum capillus-veneris]
MAVLLEGPAGILAATVALLVVQEAVLGVPVADSVAQEVVLGVLVVVLVAQEVVLVVVAVLVVAVADLVVVVVVVVVALEAVFRSRKMHTQFSNFWNLLGIYHLKVKNLLKCQEAYMFPNGTYELVNFDGIPHKACVNCYKS